MDKIFGMPLLPNRRWLRFSIRTLLVAVTIFCVWLGWQVSIVRERKALVPLVRQTGGAAWAFDEPWMQPADGPGSFRKLIGDRAWLHIVLPKKHDPNDLARVDLAFPEAIVSIQVRPSTDGMPYQMHRWPIKSEKYVPKTTQ